MYLEKFIFPDLENDNLYYDQPRGSFADENPYPFHITSEMGLWAIDFEPITILYGSNGSGKSTIINIISEKLEAQRKSMFNSGPYFEEYISRCQYKVSPEIFNSFTQRSDYRSDKKYTIADITTVLTSDDIFHTMLNLRAENDKKYHKSKALFGEYLNQEPLPTHLNFESGYNVDKFRKGVELQQARNSMRNRGKTFNRMLIDKIGKLERTYSNGETALMKLAELLEAPGLYLLDEPENSMSCEFQLKLVDIISYLARYGKCQFLISTHSPFLLSMEKAKIYNLDHYPVNVCEWWELPNMKQYFSLFYNARDHFINTMHGSTK